MEPATITVEHNFTTNQEIIDDPVFRNYLKSNISELKTNRAKRPPAGPGYKYIKNWYDRLLEMGGLNTDFFLKHIESIWDKKSLLPAEIRNAILMVCNDALSKTLIHYNQPTPVPTLHSKL